MICIGIIGDLNFVWGQGLWICIDDSGLSNADLGLGFGIKDWELELGLELGQT